MKMRAGFLLPLFAVAVAAMAEDKVSGELAGTAEIVGVSAAGRLVGDQVPGSYAIHPSTAKVSVVTKEGRVHRVETYFDWSAANGVRGRVWERLYVSGGTYTGWTERLLQTPDAITFSRNVIDGDIDQRIDPSGAGYLEWTVAGADNGVELSDGVTSGADDDEELPTVEILEENEFDGVSDRRIEIDPRGEDRATLTFRDAGYQRVTLEDADGETTVFTINQKFEFEGRGKGRLSYVPASEDETAGATPTPTPAALPTPTPAPDDELDPG